MNHGAQFSFALGTGDWTFQGSNPCTGSVSTCYTVTSVSVSVDSGASVSSSHSLGSGGAVTVSPTISNRLGPVSVTYTVEVQQYEEQTLEETPSRVDLGSTSLTVSGTLLLLPTGVAIQTQPSSAYTAATATNVAVTVQLQPAVTLTSGHPFTAEMTSVSELGTSSGRFF